ncbi:MAG: aminopeptidase [Frankiales bacterium]|nr:aminopeptidase [Frankiales bacterium]
MRNLTRDEAARRAEQVQVESYAVSLDLTQGDEGFGSTTVVRFTGRGDTFLELDAELLSATLDGGPLSLEGNRIALAGLDGTHEVRVEARCRYSRSGEGLHRFVDPADGATYLWAQSFLDDAQRMFACFDQPDLKAVFDVEVLAPEGWTVVMNGRSTQDGQRWTGSTPRISPYLFHVSAGPWHELTRWAGTVELGLYCRASLAPHLDADADELFEVTAQCFAHQERLFGRPYPFGDRYDQLFVPEFNHGAMENPGSVTFSEDFVPRSRTTQSARRKRAMVVAHEMAHMWFGDLVTMRWYDDLWLNESFAELLGFSTVEDATRFEGAWLDFCTSRKAWGYRADASPTTHPISGVVPDNRSALLNFDGISYAKGASVLRQLSVTLGPDVFFAGVRRYLDAHAWGNTAFADLLAALSAESGRDLTGWAQDWLQTSGTSLLRPVVEDGRVVVVQEGAGAGAVLREHRTAVGRYGLRDGALVRLESVDVTVAGARTPTTATPADLVLLNDGDLTFARTRFDPASLATVTEHLGALADPLARALCAASLWDALRDGELPAATFLRALRGALAVEQDPGVLETLAGQAHVAAAAYTPPAGQQAALADLADTCERLARGQEPGSDLQLVLAKTWASASSDVEALRSLRDGGLPGLAVDPDLRWHLVCRLAALGALDEAELEAEAAADRTAAGERRAAYASSARPDPAAKEAAWTSVTRDAALSNHEAAALAGGLWQHGQDAVLSPYVDRYVAEVAGVWDSRSPELARTAARLLFPSTLVRDDVLARVDALLATDLVPGLRRVVLEQRDDLARALAGQRAV